MNNRAKVKFFSGEARESLAQVKASLATENGDSAGAGAVCAGLAVV